MRYVDFTSRSPDDKTALNQLLRSLSAKTTPRRTSQKPIRRGAAPSLRYDGLYVAKLEACQHNIGSLSWCDPNYLRFYPDSTVLCATSPEDPSQVAQWLNKSQAEADIPGIQFEKWTAQQASSTFSGPGTSLDQLLRPRSFVYSYRYRFTGSEIRISMEQSEYKGKLQEDSLVLSYERWSPILYKFVPVSFQLGYE